MALLASGALGELALGNHALEGFGGALDAVEQIPAIDGQDAHDRAFATCRGKPIRPGLKSTVAPTLNLWPDIRALQLAPTVAP